MRPVQPNIPCLCNVPEGEKEVVLIDEGKDSPLGQLVKRQWKQKDVSVVMRQRPNLRLQAWKQISSWVGSSLLIFTSTWNSWCKS